MERTHGRGVQDTTRTDGLHMDTALNGFKRNFCYHWKVLQVLAQLEALEAS